MHHLFWHLITIKSLPSLNLAKGSENFVGFLKRIFSDVVINDILLSNDGGDQVAIDYKAPNVPTEAVGVWQDIDGSSGKQIEELINKIRKVQNSLTESTLPRKLTCKGFKQALWPSISYVLPAASIKEKDGRRIATELYLSLIHI